MKKKLLSILLLIFLSIGLTGCKTSIIGGVSNIKITNSNDITLSIKEDTLTNTDATIIIKNNSNKDFYYGEEFYIDIKKDNKWHTINATSVFKTPRYTITPGETKEIELKWENRYGKLDKGTYRITKSFEYEDSKGKHPFYIATEFNID